MLNGTDENKMKEMLEQAYDPETFRKNGHEIIDMLSDYLTDSLNKKGSVHSLKYNNPKDILKLWDNNFVNRNKEAPKTVINKILERSIHLHHPNNMGHQVAVSLPMAALSDLVSSLLNPTIAAFDGSESQFVIEKYISDWMCKKIGYTSKYGGFFVSGGSLGNLSALLAAREIKSNSMVWENGVKDHLNMAVMVSDNAHYCVSRSLQIMGLGKDSIISIPTTDNFHVTYDAMSACLEQAKKAGKKVFAVIGSACNTGPGTFEDLDMIADFCEANDLWFHVDGAHGGSLVLSERFKYLVKGIHRADSVVWDAHKMMMMPALCTGVLFKKYSDSFKVIQHKAPYLYDDKSKDMTKDWYNVSKRTIECTKNPMCFKIYTSLKVHGEELFSAYVTQTLLNARKLSRMIKVTQGLELALEPESNIVCFRFNPKNLTEKKLNCLQTKIRQQIVTSGNYYIVKTVLKGTTYLRTTLMNPLTTEDDMQHLVKEIQRIGISLSHKPEVSQ